MRKYSYIWTFMHMCWFHIRFTVCSRWLMGLFEKGQSTRFYSHKIGKGEGLCFFWWTDALLKILDKLAKILTIGPIPSPTWSLQSLSVKIFSVGQIPKIIQFPHFAFKTKKARNIFKGAKYWTFVKKNSHLKRIINTWSWCVRFIHGVSPISCSGEENIISLKCKSQTSS